MIAKCWLNISFIILISCCFSHIIFSIYPENFNPSKSVSRAEFGTVLSRLLYGLDNNTVDEKDRYVGHLNALNKKGIIKKINNPWDNELRGWILLMLYRSGK